MNNYIAKSLVEESCQLIQKDMPIGLRQVAAAVPLNVFYHNELSTAVGQLISTGTINQITDQ